MRYAGKTYEQGSLMADEITTRELYVGSGVTVTVVDNPVDSAGYFKALDEHNAQEKKRLANLNKKTPANKSAKPQANKAPAGKPTETETEAPPQTVPASGLPTVEELNA